MQIMKTRILKKTLDDGTERYYPQKLVMICWCNFEYTNVPHDAPVEYLSLEEAKQFIDKELESTKRVSEVIDYPK